MLWKVGLKEQRERKNKSEVTKELVERKVKKINNFFFKKYKQENKRVTYTNEEKRENSKVKECGKLGKIKYNKYNVEKKSVTYTNGERGESIKVKNMRNWVK